MAKTRNFTMKTREELNGLKEQWVADPCWDIETTEGFEEYQAELLQFRLDTEAEWSAKLQRAKQRDPLYLMRQVIEEAVTYHEAHAEYITLHNVLASEAVLLQALATAALAEQTKRLADSAIANAPR